jgi:hypothetical protein
MPIRIVHEFLQETEEGLLLTLYLSRNSHVEFGDEVGETVQPVPEDEREIDRYIRRRHPHTPISQIRLVTGDAKILVIPYRT